MKESALPETFPALQAQHLHNIDPDALHPTFSTHKPRILILYGSLRGFRIAVCLHSKPGGCSNGSVARFGYSIRKACLCPMKRRPATRR